MSQTAEKEAPVSTVEERNDVVIRFAGDSGDGMQVVGERFTDSSALAGNDVCTFPDFPSEIRAPAGSLPGVSGFQIHFGSRDILTPGDSPDALVAMNPAALKINLPDLTPKGLLIVNTSAFNSENLVKAGYETNPLDDPELGRRYQLAKLDITGLTTEALKDSALRPRDRVKCKNFFALGFVSWVFSRPLDFTEKWIQTKWVRKPEIAEANLKALRAGYYLGETSELSLPRYRVQHAVVADGLYRKITGNEAIALGLIAASESSWRDIVLGSYPITPATSILEVLAQYRNFNVKTVQAEDEIAAIGVAVGASYAGSLGVTTTSGPGLCLKSETLGLAVMTELPLVVVNVQRAGPSTGMPTKTEQADLLQALFGRHGESPLPVIAASSPADCFGTAIEAARIAIKYRTPVILLSDGYIANSSEPWKIPSVKEIPDLSVEPIQFGEHYVPYSRDPETLARRLAVPGRPGFEHRIGGLEKNEEGNVSYDPRNHERMVHLRAEKIERIAKEYPPTPVNGPAEGNLLVVGWGNTKGAITAAVQNLQQEGKSVSSVHLSYLNPLPPDLEGILRRFKQILVPELNLGQLSWLLRSKYLIEVTTYSKIQGRPITVSELKAKMESLL